MSIEKLIDKYYKKVGQDSTAQIKVNPSEKYRPEYNKKMKKEQYNRNRHLILDQLLNEIPHHYTVSEIEGVRYLIDRFNDNFKEFHRQASNEAIILAFLLIYWKQENSKLDISRLSIARRYGLTQAKFELIQNRLIFQLMRTAELTYSQAKYVNYNYLE